MLERPGGANKLLVMVLMVMGVPPFSMVGRHAGHDLAAHIWRVSLEVNLSVWTSIRVAVLAR